MKVDLADAFAPPPPCTAHPELWPILHDEMGRAGALAIIKINCGRSLVPRWLGMVGEGVPAHKLGKQGASEGPPLWNVMLGEATAPVLRNWQRGRR